MDRLQEFDKLCAEVQGCIRCPRMAGSIRVLSRAAGPISAKVMFVGEAPGRLGADSSGIPFHGDKAGHNFEALLDAAGLSREQLFVTNAVLCNPKDDRGNNDTPSFEELRNCSDHLRRQIDLVNPVIVVTLGATPLIATSMIKQHSLKLRNSVRTAVPWYGRTLIPLYHPGQRAMIHRSYANQRLDYQFVADELRKLVRPKKRSIGNTKTDVAAVANAIIAQRPGLSYFALHKLFYLVEYYHVKAAGKRLTRAYFVRQKDGAYCVDLHLAKLKKALPHLTIRKMGRQLLLFSDALDLFSREGKLQSTLSLSIASHVTHVVSRYRLYDDARLKTAVYLTEPMRAILRQERVGKMNLMNVPLLLPES